MQVRFLPNRLNSGLGGAETWRGLAAAWSGRVRLGMARATTRRGAREADRARLESVSVARHRGFESRLLRSELGVAWQSIKNPEVEAQRHNNFEASWPKFRNCRSLHKRQPPWWWYGATPNSVSHRGEVSARQ